MKENLISVIVCSYNQEGTIARALDSVLMQQCHIPFEIIIGEDGSSDGTLTICQDYARRYPDTIRLMNNKQNKGVVNNYFDCLLAAKGELVADCAGDDFWVDPLKLEKEVTIMAKHPDVTMVLTRWNWYDEQTQQTIPGPPPPFTTDIVKGTDAIEAILTQTDMSVFHLCTSLYRASAFQKAYEEDNSIFRNKTFGTEDIQVAFVMARQGNIAYLPDVTMHYSTGKPSASQLVDDEKQFWFVHGITDLCHYLTEKYHIHSERINQSFTSRIFALAMHAFRSHNSLLFQETMRCEAAWNIRQTRKTKIAYAVMRHPWLWTFGLQVRRIYVTLKQKRHHEYRVEANFTGRLGNQLFIYAYARKLLEMQQARKELYANFEGTKGGSEEDGFTDSIRYFHVFPYQTKTYNLIRHDGSWLQKLLYFIYVICMKLPIIADNRERFIALNRSVEWSGLYYTGVEDKARIPRPVSTKSVFVSGFFQDKQNFDSIRHILIKELTPKYPPLSHNQHLYQVANFTNSVCVSIRRGDFLTPQNKSNFYICTPSYFQKAILVMKEKVDNPVFIFFSDDIKWVQQNIQVQDIPCYYESGNDPVWEKLRLMYSCHHFIISNSTFSWWAQYLGRHNDKIVVCPSRWYANPAWTSNLIEDSFITIDV